MHVRALHRDLRRDGGHGPVVLVRRRDAALANSRPLDDPLVVRIEPHPRELVFAETRSWRSPANAGEIDERTLPAWTPGAFDSPSSSPMWLSSFFVAARA